MKQQSRYVSLDNVDALASCSELVPDLAAIAMGLDADTAGPAEAAMTWIDSVGNDATVCEVAKEMLAPLQSFP